MILFKTGLTDVTKLQVLTSLHCFSGILILCDANSNSLFSVSYKCVNRYIVGVCLFAFDAVADHPDVTAVTSELIVYKACDYFLKR